MTLDEARAGIGRLVIYGQWQPDEGVITSVNDRFVFVQYRGDLGSKATEPGSLRFSIDQEGST